MAVQKESVLYGVIGLVAGALIAGGSAIAAVNSNNRNMMRMMGMSTTNMMDTSSGHMGMSMDQMSNELTGRSGDNFDENFLAMMIAHHQGAVDMAKLAGTRAKHDEIKQMSQDIINAQTKEIGQMQQWQKDWGYTANSSTNSMHNH